VTFAALTVGLLLTTIFQVRFGLAPLKRISNSLAAIRSGQAERLEGEFPVEIAPLARETNALLDANRAIVERSRTHVGNLAHAIKTPLSVIVNEAGAIAASPSRTRCSNRPTSCAIRSRIISSARASRRASPSSAP
jgi:signal transduction histidine kinase